ncbi:MAG TPA: hypothetical protein PKE45_14635, partial [Caldilineaceae bacterium]|nr:hypothetical protein [Caldilineaceae bacterium]
MSTAPDEQPAWLHGHAHEPNPAAPTTTTAFTLAQPAMLPRTLDVADLLALPATTISDCYIVSTGHGTSGPFCFTGVRLCDLLEHLIGQSTPWNQVDVVSADGFGTRILRNELFDERTR